MVAGPRFEPTGGGKFSNSALLIAHEISLREKIHSLISSENSLFCCIGNFS